MRTFVVVLLANRNPYDGEGGLRVVQADTAEEAVRRAHAKPPSTLKVRWAWVAELATPYQPTMVPVEVPEPEWGQPKPAASYWPPPPAGRRHREKQGDTTNGDDA